MTDMEITNELLAAYAEGNVSQKEREAVRQYLAENPDKMASVLIAMECCDGSQENNQKNCNITSKEYGQDVYIQNLGAMLDNIESGNTSISSINHNLSILPMQAMAAKNIIDNHCAVRCEGVAIRHFGIEVTDEELMKESEQSGWLQPEGTALHNIGRLSGTRGLSVRHRYHCTIEDIQESLKKNDVVIAVVDGNELVGDYKIEQKRDMEIGLNPNHAVVVRSVYGKTVTIKDFATPFQKDLYSLSQFLDAWEDSQNYLIVISNRKEYIPHPINLNDVEVEGELIELREAIAENAHEVWAESRREEGWTYGPVRNDEKKQHPDMLPYNRLPESEKEYDRLMAMNTIKLVKKLGWELRKINAKSTSQNTSKEIIPSPYHCNVCHNVVYKHDVFCSKCGKKLDYYDFKD